MLSKPLLLHHFVNISFEIPPFFSIVKGISGRKRYEAFVLLALGAKGLINHDTWSDGMGLHGCIFVTYFFFFSFPSQVIYDRHRGFPNVGDGTVLLIYNLLLRLGRHFTNWVLDIGDFCIGRFGVSSGYLDTCTAWARGLPE